MIYKLWRLEDVGYDEYDAKIVRAPTEEIARIVANEKVGDEGQMWTDHARVGCIEIDLAGETMELLGSFNAG